MALKFLNKKGWHTGSLRNIENVWKAEQKHDAEQKKLEELRKQIVEERERSEFRLLQEQAGLVPYVFPQTTPQTLLFSIPDPRVRVSFDQHFTLLFMLAISAAGKRDWISCMIQVYPLGRAVILMDLRHLSPYQSLTLNQLPPPLLLLRYFSFSFSLESGAAPLVIEAS